MINIIYIDEWALKTNLFKLNLKKQTHLALMLNKIINERIRNANTSNYIKPRHEKQKDT